MELLQQIKYDWKEIQYTNSTNQPLEMCLHALKKSWLAIKYIVEKNQTPQICLMAVQSSWKSIKYITSPSVELCLIAIIMTI